MTDRTPPSQPPGWLDPDALHVEPRVPEPWSPREVDGAPLSRGCALFAFGVCIGTLIAITFLLLAPVIDATPRSAPDSTVERPASERPTVGADDPSLPVLDASGPELSGAPQPQPVDVLGSVLAGGFATWCAPTPTQCQAWGGGALLAAMPGWDGPPVDVRVCTEGSRCVVVTVVSSCGCGDRHGRPTVIDLSPAAFEQLAPLRRGVVLVTVEWPLP